MGFRSANRGVSEVVGAMLLFGVLVLGLGMYQVHVVPTEDSRIEHDHHEDVRDKMRTLGNAVADAGLAGNRETVELEPTVRYPPRPLTMHRASGGGSFGAAADSTIEFGGLSATGPASVYWDGTDRSFDTTLVTHRAGYRHYKAPERTTLEPLATHTAYEDGMVFETPRRLVDGHTISVVTVEGAGARTTRAKTLDVRPISSADDGFEALGGFTVTVPTTAPESEWNDVLDDEPASLADYRTRSGKPNLATVATNTGETYTVQLGAVSLNGQTRNPAPAYLIAEGTEEATVTVYDEYGNPLTHETVFIESPGGTVRQDTTDDDGEVSFTATADGTHNIWADAGSYTGATDPLRTQLVLSTPGDAGPADPINPGSPGSVRLASVSHNGKDVTMTFENLDTRDRTVVEARLNLYIKQQNKKGGGANVPTQGTLKLADGTSIGVLQIGGAFVSLSPQPTISQTGTTDLVLTFTTNPNPNDWFVITMTYADGASVHYFVQIR